ncbi:MAG: hypothetical protein H0T88_01955 [Lysobacter sp.]|nr:hypothetical protein [Lysobacter sp.]MDQ3511641.1 hypothetical protein [Pseudomonadota bacterium]
MSRYSSLPERALEMAMQVVPQSASKMLQTGVALGALKTGTRVATAMIRRNPALAAAAAAGAGALWLLARRQAKKAERGPIDSTSTRVEARRAGTSGKSANGSSADASSRAKPRKTTTRSRARKTTPSS